MNYVYLPSLKPNQIEFSAASISLRGYFLTHITKIFQTKTIDISLKNIIHTRSKWNK